MVNNRMMWQMNRERHSELLDVAQAQRLIKGPRARRSYKPHFFANVGDLLISVGHRLKTQASNAVSFFL